MHRWQTGREQQERWRAAITGFSVFVSIVSSTEEQMQHADIEDMIKVRRICITQATAMLEQAHVGPRI
jgi:hypothetical protein